MTKCRGYIFDSPSRVVQYDLCPRFFYLFPDARVSLGKKGERFFPFPHLFLFFGEHDGEAIEIYSRNGKPDDEAQVLRSTNP